MNNEESGLLTPNSAKIGALNSSVPNRHRSSPGFDRSNIMLRTNEFLQKVEDSFYGMHIVSFIANGGRC